MTNPDVADALEAAKMYREALKGSDIVEADARDVVILADEIERLRATLHMIETAQVSVNGLPVNEAMWLREFAREALSGIDPTTGRPAVEPSSDALDLLQSTHPAKTQHSEK